MIREGEDGETEKIVKDFLSVCGEFDRIVPPDEIGEVLTYYQRIVKDDPNVVVSLAYLELKERLVREKRAD